MKILFITSSRIGDAVLSTGILDYIANSYPNASVTVACGPLAVSLFEGAPMVDNIISLKKESYSRHWIRLWKQIVLTPWDIVIDLRNSAVSRLIIAKQRFVFGPHIDKKLHKVVQNACVIGQQSTMPLPRLWFSKAQLSKADDLIGKPEAGHTIIAIGPAANWIGKTWPVDRFISICQWLIADNGYFPNARVAIFGAPGEENICQELIDSLPAERTINLVSKGNPGEAAAMLSRCEFYLGNDSGLMHAAAAAGVKTFGVFGPSYPHIYEPWGDHCDYISTPETFDELIDYEGYTPQSAPCLMTSLTVEMVKESLDKFLSAPI